jgi:hypothetical protein
MRSNDVDTESLAEILRSKRCAVTLQDLDCCGGYDKESEFQCDRSRITSAPYQAEEAGGERRFMFKNAIRNCLAAGTEGLR